MLIDLKIPNPPFSQFFSADFVGAETLTDGERIIIGTAVNQRVKHFSTGRYCAKTALKTLGIEDVEILRNDDKAPIWPDDVVGSISHSKYLAGAVVGHSHMVKAIGLDIETIGGVKDNLWDMLFVPTEQLFLYQLKEEEVAFYAALLFSAKEAFYKLQHPITKTFLDFTDVEIKLINNSFFLTIVKDFPGKGLLPASTPIHFAQQGDQVITLCYLEK